MDVERAAHRQSRAPWESNAAAKVNPYARAAATSVSSVGGGPGAGRVQATSPYGRGNGSTSIGTLGGGRGGGSGAPGGGNLLEVPKLRVPEVPQQGTSGNSNRGLSPGMTSSRRHNRRASVHASVAAQHRRSFLNAQRPLFDNQSVYGADNVGGSSGVGNTVLADLADGTATEIDDYYKVLTKQKDVVTRDIKTKINENQKNILELTNDLKATQDELLLLRVSTRDLYEILDDFKDAAVRRLELEKEINDHIPHSQSQRSLNSSRSSLGNNSRNRSISKRDRLLIIYLEKMWNEQLQLLFKHVDGALNFIQPIPGRHILAESGRWSEINIANWKVVRHAHLFVFNDVVLLASKKTSSSNTMAVSGNGSNSDTAALTPTTTMAPTLNLKQKLQAIFCWSLQDLKFSEVSGPNSKPNEENKTYAINLKLSTLSYTFQTDRYDHFLKILEAIKKALNELQQKSRHLELSRVNAKAQDKKHLRESLRNSEIENEKRKSGSNSRTTSMQQKRNSQDAVLQDISAKVHSRNRLNDFTNSREFGSKLNGSQAFSELKRLEDRIDEVDVEIAHCRYTESIGLLRYVQNKLESVENSIVRNREKALESDDLAYENELQILIEVITVKLNSRKSQIEKAITFNLHKNINLFSREEIAESMEFFRAFSETETGVTAFLDAMLNYLTITTLKLVQGVQGLTKLDAVNYLLSLVVIHVVVIKRTINVFKTCIVPVLMRDENGNAPNMETDNSGLITWCNVEMTSLVSKLKKHLYGTLVTPITTGMEASINGEPIYQVKDVKLFNEFLGVLKPQLDQLKASGVDMDFLFQDLFLLNHS